MNHKQLLICILFTHFSTSSHITCSQQKNHDEAMFIAAVDIEENKKKAAQQRKYIAHQTQNALKQDEKINRITNERSRNISRTHTDDAMGKLDGEKSPRNKKIQMYKNFQADEKLQIRVLRK